MKRPSSDLAECRLILPTFKNQASSMALPIPSDVDDEETCAQTAGLTFLGHDKDDDQT